MMRNDRIMLECLEKELRLIKAEVDDIEKKACCDKAEC